ncbi:cytochrome P450 [Spirosoma utsteinense]|uniref:Cytochrome P450 n=1 Tax=Spirosoma utsteinense TaxID=2585773 RepID=A0ABR6WAG0_9BACT|nr:cytochrome P450 [Spirosoma utsteinense]MBC3784024.1 cytochrome P450 [Spirosoma utsteinense]MBC3793487.1 cytochrome P450 [Spirosoma utsteinense]
METLNSSPTRPAPLHPGLPMLGNTLSFLRDPLAILNTLQKRYDRIVHLRIGGRHQYLVLQPDDARHVIQENHRNYVRSPAFNVLKIFLGNGLLTSDGDFWRRQRRLAQPAFHRQRLAALAQTMVDETADWIDDLRQLNHSQPLNASQALMDVTMRIVCKTLFGSDVIGKLDGLSMALDTLQFQANQRMLSPIRFPMRWPTPAHQRFRRAGELVDSFIYGVINQRRNDHTDQRDDLLAMLQGTEDEDTGERMSDQQLRDECVTIFAAGHETTAVSMAWTLHLLTEHPAVLARLQAEAKTVLGDKRTPPPDAFRALPYAMQVVQESLRLYPPAWIMSRLAIADDPIGPHTIPAGSTALVSPYLLHRDPASWPDPERFDPERFAPNTSGTLPSRHSYAYLPFGGGPRLCIGNQFALMEMQILLAMLVRTFSIFPVPNQRINPHPLITLRPKNPICVYLK